ncbi:MAG: hypothetical protein JNK16_10710 [Phycisphaerales bacterium]|nr:hypothetical protein [Phycisphaerales bacterium]
MSDRTGCETDRSIKRLREDGVVLDRTLNKSVTLIEDLGMAAMAIAMLILDGSWGA